jgi:4'-phosphopantetheinyl transferase
MTAPSAAPSETPEAWGPAPPRPILGPAEVHVWRVDLGRADSGGAALSDDERARAARFHSDRDRERFTASHAALRTILGLYTGCRPDELTFEAGPHGKPSLMGQPGATIAFNMSHSGSLAVVAIATGRRVGIDVEGARPMAERDTIVARFLSARERSDFARLPETLQTAAFFRVWTCKEAYIKAIGTGLATPLDSFSVSVDPREPPGLLDIAGDPDEAARWSIDDLDIGPGYAGAVMAEGAGWSLICYEYDERPLTRT